MKDRAHWLASAKREEFFGPLGVTNIRTFIDRKNPTHGTLIMDIPDMDAFNAAMQFEGAAYAMAYDGVLPETLVVLVESWPKRQSTSWSLGPDRLPARGGLAPRATSLHAGLDAVMVARSTQRCHTGPLSLRRPPFFLPQA